MSNGRLAARLWAWPSAWPLPSGPLGWQRLRGQRRAAGASRVAGCEAPLRLEGQAGIAGAVAVADPDHAERIAQSITDERIKAEALGDIGESGGRRRPDHAV